MTLWKTWLPMVGGWIEGAFDNCKELSFQKIFELT